MYCCDKKSINYKTIQRSFYVTMIFQKQQISIECFFKSLIFRV